MRLEDAAAGKQELSLGALALPRTHERSPESVRVARQYAVPASLRARVTEMAALEAVGSCATAATRASAQASRGRSYAR